MHRIILLGYMGAGKTTVGRLLARTVGLPFYDLDWYIEQRMRKSVAKLFAERGEEGFRLVERNMLHEVAEFEDVVVSCGGGTPCFFDNMEYMNAQGTTVYLKAPIDVLMAHLQMGHTVRPLLAGLTPEQMRQRIGEQLSAREQYYNKARMTLDIGLLDNEGEIGRTVDRLREMVGL